MNHPYELSPVLTGLSLAYQNPTYNLIADKILPRVPVAGELFKYSEYPIDAFLNVPDTLIGRKGVPNKLDISAETKLANIEYHGIKEEVPIADIEAATDGNDPRKNAVTQLTGALTLAREIRVANLMQDPANYANKITLASSEQLDNKESDALQLFSDVRKSMLMKPNCAIMTETTASYLQRHPDFLTNYFNENKTRGEVPLEFLRQMLRVDELFIGEVNVNTAKKGQKASIENVWGNNIAFFYKDPTATPEFGLTFGFSAQLKGRKVITYLNPDPGPSGVENIKVVDELKELIVAPSCGYLIQNVISTAKL